MKYVVASVDEIEPGGRKIVTVGRRSIGIFNLDGEFFALRNHCPHMGAPLCTGKLWGYVRSDSPGTFDYTPKKEILSCPHHGWEYHIRTGQSWCDPDRLKASEYTVAVETGEQLLDELRPPNEGPPNEGPPNEGLPDVVPPGKVKGPYVAETIDVVVEGEYLVIDL